ncbi:GNAT family N-acetyltransferase [Mucilaginibacter sp.]|uniref:GNAT family N-acetyltransferase n=1 Tax=Mucilaginibacter sp. TaxID=1882438 RepID=UPI00263831E7|nr:GNAT family N-acetyltransferase [Mucilaginibacter sp.]MDB4925256.1 Acetyltransferase protein [Mucilaginibacter sp.]
MIKILTIKDKAEWVTYVNQSVETDFYHTWHYHSLDNTGSPILFVYSEQSDFIAIPLIQRKIPESNYYDLTCVYGYSGPLSNQKMDGIDSTLVSNFKSAFLKFLSDGNYVSVFLRLNPFYNQQLLLKEFGGIYDNGQVVVIDLNKSIEQHRKDYRQTTWDSIRKSLKNGYNIKEEKGPEAVKIFSEIYNQNMNRVRAADSYLFDNDYYLEMLSNTEYNARIFMAYKGDVVASSTIAVFTNEIIQLHLIGTRTEYLQDSPAKFLIDGVMQIGCELGMRYYNLGGGLGFQKDSLFYWKNAFSDLLFDYKSWRYIANPVIYQQLLDQKGIDKNTEVDFFPLYRYTLALQTS